MNQPNPTKRPLKSRKKTTLETRRPKPLVRAHSAGAVVYTTIDGQTNFLLIKHKHSDDWSIPKGYVKPRERPEAVAGREVEEETGIRSRPIEFLGIAETLTEYRVHRMDRKIRLFLLEADGDLALRPEKFDPIEKMVGDAAWVTPEEALKRVKVESVRALIAKARDRVKELSHA